MKLNILEHHYVPKHDVLTDSEAKKLLSTLEYDAEDLPKIKVSDPVAKTIDAKAGDILRITRESETAGTFVTYRLVEE